MRRPPALHPSQLAFAYYSAPTDTSGVTEWLTKFIRHWTREDHTVAVQLFQLGWQFNGSPLSRSFADQPLQLHAQAHPITTQQGVRSHLQFLNLVCPQVFIPQCLVDAHFAAKYAANFGLKWVFTLHSDDPVYWALADLCGPSRQQGVWVAVSEHIAQIARTKYPHAQVEVIPCGVDIPQATTCWNETHFRVVYSGRMIEHQKCISKVLSTLMEFCRRMPQAEAVLMGGGDLIPSLTEQVEKAGLSHRIRFTGHLTPVDLQAELLQAQAILLQSDFEGLPIALMEGMAHGVVPVARFIPSGIPELVHHEETGLLANALGTDAVEHLMRLAQDRQLWERLSTAARVLVETQFSRQECFNRWSHVLSELAPTSTPSYPLPIPLKIDLPKVDDRIKHFDLRHPTYLAICKYWVKQAIITFKRSFARAVGGKSSN